MTRLAKEWAQQKAKHMLVSSFDRETHGLVDVMQFVLKLARHRRSKKQYRSKELTDFLDMWRKALVAWLGFRRVAGDIRWVHLRASLYGSWGC